MNSSYWIALVIGGCDPQILGPYENELARDQAAWDLRHKESDEDSVFALNIDEQGIPSMWPYTGGFMEDPRPTSESSGLPAIPVLPVSDDLATQIPKPPMKLKALRLLLQRAARTCESPTSVSPYIRLNTAASLRHASRRLAVGDLSLPWRNGNGSIKVDQPIADLKECGTPVDPDQGDDLVLDIETG